MVNDFIFSETEINKLQQQLQTVLSDQESALNSLKNILVTNYFGSHLEAESIYKLAFNLKESLEKTIIDTKNQFDELLNRLTYTSIKYQTTDIEISDKLNLQ